MSAHNRATAFEVDIGSVMPLQDMSGRGGLLSAVSATPDTKPKDFVPMPATKPMGPA